MKDMFATKMIDLSQGLQTSFSEDHISYNTIV